MGGAEGCFEGGYRFGTNEMKIIMGHKIRK